MGRRDIFSDEPKTRTHGENVGEAIVTKGGNHFCALLKRGNCYFLFEKNDNEGNPINAVYAAAVVPESANLDDATFYQKHSASAGKETYVDEIESINIKFK